MDTANAIETITYGYESTLWGDLLTNINGTEITYDASGNPTKWHNSPMLSWSNQRLSKFYFSNGRSYNYTYNSDGIRTGKSNAILNTHEYILDGTKILRETVTGIDNYVFNYFYDESGNVLGFKYNNVTYTYLKNIQGDVIGIIDNTGARVVSYTYDVWGKILSITGDSAGTIGKYNPFRYRSYYYDNESGFYYLNSRYYDPTVGRFLSPDTTDVLSATPMGLTDKNLYAYCDNNPIVRADHGGDFWHIIVGAAVGAIVGGVANAVSNVVEGKSLTDGLGTAMLSGAASGALASTGVGIVGMVAGNAAISMAENAVNQVVENKGFNNFDVGDMLIDGAIGGISGAIGGAGKGTKHLTNLGKQTVKRTFDATANKGLNAGLKEAGKAFVYYGKNSTKYYKDLVLKLPKDVISATVTEIASSDYMKYQYQRILGG